MPQPPKTVVLSKKKIGARVQRLRQGNRMTQAELAQALGTHAASISQVERGIRGLSVQQIVKLARALKVPTDSILGESRKIKNDTKPVNPRLLRRVNRIQDLPTEERRAVLKILDSLLEKHSGNGKK